MIKDNPVIIHLEEIAFGIHIKAALAAAAACFVEIFYGDLVVLNIYMAFMTADLVLGMTIGCIYGRFDPRKVMHWAYKFGTNLVLIILLGFACHAFFRTTAVPVPVINWMLLVFISVDLAAIIDKLELLGLPVPPIVRTIVRMMRTKASSSMLKVFHADPELRKEVRDTFTTGDGHADEPN